MKFGYARVSGLSQDLKLQVKQLEDQGVPKGNFISTVLPAEAERSPFAWGLQNRKKKLSDHR